MTRVLALHYFREHVRSRFFALSAVFGVLMLYLSLLLGVLAADQEPRVLLDFGLSFIEWLGAASGAFAATSGLLGEIENKSVVLILTRPVPRWRYLLGRTAGLLLACACSIALMGAMHLLILFAKGWPFDPLYALALGGIFLKILIVASLATLLALGTTSSLSALGITAVLWTLGHFTREIHYWTAKSRGLSSAFLRAAPALLPDLQWCNLRDRMGTGAETWTALVYAPAYALGCLALAYLLLRKKEF